MFAHCPSPSPRQEDIEQRVLVIRWLQDIFARSGLGLDTELRTGNVGATARYARFNKRMEVATECGLMYFLGAKMIKVRALSCNLAHYSRFLNSH